MPAECSPTLMQFARLDGRVVVTNFGGGVMTSDARALLLGATLVGQRVLSIALGYEDLIDHDELRHDLALGAVRIARRWPASRP